MEHDKDGRLISLAWKQVPLTPTEFKLLAMLVRHAGKVVTQRQLLVEVWGPGAATITHYLRVQMHGLRHKLEETAARPRNLITEPGVGYRLRDDGCSCREFHRQHAPALCPLGQSGPRRGGWLIITFFEMIRYQLPKVSINDTLCT